MRLYAVESENGLYASSNYESVDVQVYWCVYSTFCSVVQTESGVDLCDYVEAQDSQTCPEAGAYTFQTSFTLPSDISSSGYWVTVVITFADQYGVSSSACDVTILVNETEMYTMASMVGVALLAGVVFGVRRRRRRLRIATEEAPISTNFEMMKDPVYHGAVV